MIKLENERIELVKKKVQEYLPLVYTENIEHY